jgi:hypothetical protein
MFKKTVKFENFLGVEVERDFYFHLSKTELLAMANDGDDFQKRIERIQVTKDVAGIVNEFRALVKLSVGIRSEDGERFIKDAAAQSMLLDSPAFDELLFGLVTEPNAAVDFVKQLIPEKLQKQLEEEMKKAGDAPDPFKNPDDNRPDWVKEKREPTPLELQRMSPTELQEAFRARLTK